MKRIILLLMLLYLSCHSLLFAQEGEGGASIQNDIASQAVNSVFDFGLGGIFGAVTIDGVNYQQIGFRPEITLWKLGLALDVDILLDDKGKIRGEDWDERKDYIDKIYYIRWGQKGDPFYFKYGQLDSVTMGYGTLIYGYTNTLEYPTYKRQGLELSIDTTYMGIEAIANDLKELKGDNKGVMGGGRIYIKPFSRLQIGASVAADLNEYKGLRDTDNDGIPDEMDAYPYDKKYATEKEYYSAHLPEYPLAPDYPTVTKNKYIETLIKAGLISPVDRRMLMDINEERSSVAFWATDIGLRMLDFESFKMDIYSQYATCVTTNGWGYTAPGIKIKAGKVLELYGDYRQQSDDFIFGYFNDTYDLERAKYVYQQSVSSPRLFIHTKKEKLDEAEHLRGYSAGLKLNLFVMFTGKAEYSDMRWGDAENEDKSIRGEIAMKNGLIPVISKLKGFYTQTNVEKLHWRTESTLWGGVVGIGISKTASVDVKYVITYEDRNGDGDVNEKDETITNVSVSTSTLL